MCFSGTERLQDQAGQKFLSAHLIPLRQGLSLNVELGCQPVDPSSSAASAPNSTGVAGTKLHSTF